MKSRARSFSFRPRPRRAGRLSRKAAAAYLRLGLNDKLEKEDFVALKIHFGEKHNTGHIRPAMARRPGP